MTRKQTKPKLKSTTKCPDCGREYEAGAPHQMFCPAHTCRNCSRSFSYVLPVYDSRPEALDEDGNPERRCDFCLGESDGD